MIRLKNTLINIHGIAILLVSFYWLFLFLASGHGLNFKDFAQVKLIIEIVIFFSAAVTIFFKKRNFLFGDLMLIVLLILVQLSFIDIYMEISEKPVIFLTVFFLLFISNLFLIYSQIKARVNQTPSE
jgi:hypothetical protein